MRRSHIPVAFLIGALLLAGCASQAPATSSRDDDEDAEETTEVAQITAEQLDGLFDPSSTLEAFNLSLDYEESAWPDWVERISSYWKGATRTTENACYDSFAASFLIGDNNDDNVHVAIADDDSESPNRYVGVEARVFASADDAATFLGLIKSSAQKCSDVGGYKLYNDEDEQVWGITAVDAADAVYLDLPRSVSAVYVEDEVDPAFANGSRLTFLQYSNIVALVTVQADAEAEFTLQDGDELAELVALRLTELD